jgi:hypothetical protein
MDTTFTDIAKLFLHSQKREKHQAVWAVLEH